MRSPQCGAADVLFSLGEGGRVALETADCSAGADANETEPADRRLAGVFILWEEGGGVNMKRMRGMCGRLGERWR